MGNVNIHGNSKIPSDVDMLKLLQKEN